MTDKQEQILAYLRRCTSPATPTEIGMACGRPYHSASSWAASGLRTLVSAGTVVRYDGGYYELPKTAA